MEIYQLRKFLSPSEEEAKKKIYSVCTSTYTGFGALISEELSYKVKGIVKISSFHDSVIWILCLKWFLIFRASWSSLGVA